MHDHLRFAGQPYDTQCEALERIVRAEPLLMAVLAGIRSEGLPDAWLVSGAIYNTVWNVLTGRPPLTGVNDFDIAYFDNSDLSYGAEDRVIRRLAARFAHLPIRVEPRNQARVHLWFPQRFGQPYAPLENTTEMLTRFASKTHAVAVRLEPDESLSVVSPFGLEALFAFRVEPNHAVDNRITHEAKAARAKAIWWGLTIEPW